MRLVLPLLLLAGCADEAAALRTVRGSGSERAVGRDFSEERPIDFLTSGLSLFGVDGAGDHRLGALRSAGPGAFEFDPLACVECTIFVQDADGGLIGVSSASDLEVDFSYVSFGRFDATLLEDTATVTLSASDLSAWQPQDTLEYVAWDSGDVEPRFQELAKSGEFPAGATSLSMIPLDVNDVLHGIDRPSRGTLLHLARTSSAAGQLVRRAVERLDFDLPAGAPLSIDGAFVPMPVDVTRTFRFVELEFVGSKAAVSGEAVALTNVVIAGSLPRASELGRFAQETILYWRTARPDGADEEITLEMPAFEGDPLLIAETQFGVEFRAGFASAATFVGAIGALYQLSEVPSDLRPSIAPVRNLAIDGRSLDRAVEGVSIAPLVTWEGEGAIYTVVLYAIAENLGRTAFGRVARISTDRERAWIPPGVLVPGVKYFLRVNARTAGDVKAPRKNLLPVGYADRISATISM